jgi:hypothetical protein
MFWPIFHYSSLPSAGFFATAGFSATAGSSSDFLIYSKSGFSNSSS